MSRPRTPFGHDQPGRLPATMIKVLAAEMSDPGRLSRGKRMWTENAVLDIVIGHGAVTAEVQGSRPLPYVVTLETRAGIGAPGRRDLSVRCTCPDDDGAGHQGCKHAVAALFALSDEVAIEPEVLARWRRSDSVAPGAAVDDVEPEQEASPVRLRAVAPITPIDELGPLLVHPAGRSLPPVPMPPDGRHPRPADQLVADVLDDALDHLRIRWE